MVPWKTDPVYRRTFNEIMTLWTGLDPADRPMALRVEEHASPRWGAFTEGGAVLNTWMVDDAGPRLFQGLGREPYFPGTQRGSCSQFGLVRFHVDATGRRVTISYHLGPEIEGEHLYLLDQQGPDLTFSPHLRVS